MLATRAPRREGSSPAAWGTDPAFIIDSATFLLSIVFIARIQYRTTPRSRYSRQEPRAPRSTITLNGLRYLARHRDILVIVLQKAALTLLVVGAFEVLQVGIARDVFVHR